MSESDISVIEELSKKHSIKLFEDASSKNDIIREVMLSEYTSLRREAESIRRCQTTYFWSSITASGTIMGLSPAFHNYIGNNKASYVVFSFFAPLILITPIWCIVFDKTSTLFRISSYIRVLENLILDFDGDGKRLFCGYENYTKAYRRLTAKTYHDRFNADDNVLLNGIKIFFHRLFNVLSGALLRDDSGIEKVLNFKRPNQTVYLAWMVYFVVSLFCVCMVFASSENGSVFHYLSATIFSVAVIYTLYVVRELVDGSSRSQSYHEEFCMRCLKFSYENRDNIYSPVRVSYEPPSRVRLLLLCIIVIMFFYKKEVIMVDDFVLENQYNMVRAASMVAGILRAEAEAEKEAKIAEVCGFKQHYVCQDVNYHCEEFSPPKTPSMSDAGYEVLTDFCRERYKGR